MKVVRDSKSEVPNLSGSESDVKFAEIGESFGATITLV